MASANNRLVTSEMELRHLNISEKLRLSEILDRNESWVKLMEAIPRDILDAQPLNRDTKIARRKYSSDNIRYNFLRQLFIIIIRSNAKLIMCFFLYN